MHGMQLKTHQRGANRPSLCLPIRQHVVIKEKYYFFYLWALADQKILSKTKLTTNTSWNVFLSSAAHTHKKTMLCFPGKGKQEDVNSCKAEVTGFCCRKLSWLAKWLRCKDCQGLRWLWRAGEGSRQHINVSAFACIAHAHAQPAAYVRPFWREGEANNIDENQQSAKGSNPRIPSEPIT